MCGIAAFLADGAIAGLHHDSLIKSLELIAHRGEFAYQQELYSGPTIIGGANRLAFTSKTDPQPAVSPDGRYAIFLNGEIYDLHSRSGDPKSDTARLAKLIQERGLDIFRDLDGIFAVIVIDTYERDIWLVRDQFGIKPLYYSATKLGVLIASEIKALATHAFVETIVEVPPGTILRICRDTLSIEHDNYQADFTHITNEYNNSLDDFVKGIIVNLTDAIISQTRDGQEYAVYLSGGLDSSSIYAICKLSGVNVTPLVLGSASCQDVQYAQRLCTAFGDEVQVIVCPPEECLFRILHTIIYHCESFEPNVVRASAINWVLAQGAFARGFRVALCGEGADELFGGYPEFYSGPLNFNDTRQRFMGDLHRTQLQRVDRMNMASTIEARVPFLSRRLAAMALNQKNSEFFVQQSVGTVETKAALRRAMQQLLPAEIVNRPKVVMNEGAGYGSNSAEHGMFSSLAANLISDYEFHHFVNQFPEWSLSTREEVVYFKVFHGLGYSKLLSAKKRVFANRIQTLQK